MSSAGGCARGARARHPPRREPGDPRGVPPQSLWIVLAIPFVGSSLAMILPELLDGGTTRYDVAVVHA